MAMLKHILAGLLLIAGLGPAMAQSNNILVVATCGSAVLQPGPNRIGVITVDTSGNLCTGSGGGGGASDVNINQVNGAPPSATNPIWVAPASSTAFPIIAAPRSAITISGCSVGTSSALCLAASTAVVWIQVQNTHATNSIACSWGGVAALNASGSFMLAPGQSASWGPNTSGVPTNALNCIASGAATPLYLERR